MPQLHLYVPEGLAAEVARRARARGLSVSRYLAEFVQHQMRTAWPKGYFEEVVGTWQSGPPSRPPQGKLEVRDGL